MSLVCFKNIGELIQTAETAPPKIVRRKNCALIVNNGKVHKVVRNSGQRPRDYSRIIDLEGKTVVPGFVDCHTHLIYAGHRKDEMEERLKNDLYPATRKPGDGIHATVSATRKATEDQLFETAHRRMNRMTTLGTTAFEIKSGYGLSHDAEIKILKVGKRLKDKLKVPVHLTYLGAHAIPTGSSAGQYLESVIYNLKSFRGLAESVDILCEQEVYSASDLRRLFLQAKLLGFQLRAHVEELSHSGGCYEAAKLGAMSCDHLEYARPRDIHAMKIAGAVAVLMPTVTIFLGREKLPLVHTMLDLGVPLALATDCNPGSSPTYNMQTVLQTAMSLYRITPAQALAAATLGGAKALGDHKIYGGLTQGLRADFVVLKTGDYRDLFYYVGENIVEQTYIAGVRKKNFVGPVEEL
tara:strand:- start:917 stop:2146 length:1230 start_codon:yes stop_codon:yes gene_type:complete